MAYNRWKQRIIISIAIIAAGSTPAALAAKDIVPQKEMARRLTIALCNRMAACHLLGTTSKAECIETGSDSGGERDVVPKVSSAELAACVKALERFTCEQMERHDPPPDPCSFMKDM